MNHLNLGSSLQAAVRQVVMKPKTTTNYSEKEKREPKDLKKTGRWHTETTSMATKGKVSSFWICDFFVILLAKPNQGASKITIMAWTIWQWKKKQEDILKKRTWPTNFQRYVLRRSSCSACETGRQLGKNALWPRSFAMIRPCMIRPVRWLREFWR